MERVYINGKSVFPFKSKEELLKFISKEKKILIAMNTEKILSSNNKLQSIINDNIAYPDGIGAVMALRRKSIKAAKIPGAYLWQDIIKQFYHDKSFYLIGSTDEVINSTVKKLKSEYPKIRIAGFRNGYFDNHEFAAILEDIKN